jgi:hypothetical protein
VTPDPQDRRRLRLWGWVALAITVVIALVYLLIAKPWSTYDGKKPNTSSHGAREQLVTVRLPGRSAQV